MDKIIAIGFAAFFGGILLLALMLGLGATILGLFLDIVGWCIAHAGLLVGILLGWLLFAWLLDNKK